MRGCILGSISERVYAPGPRIKIEFPSGKVHNGRRRRNIWRQHPSGWPTNRRKGTGGRCAATWMDTLAGSLFLNWKQPKRLVDTAIRSGA